MQDSDAEAIDERLAASLRTLRESAGMSQAALATEMSAQGVPWHQQTVGRIEAGRQQVRFSEAVILAAVLGVPLDRLTWASQETAATEAVLKASASMTRAAKDVSRAASNLLAARSAAQEVLASTAAASQWSRVRDLRHVLTELMAQYDLVAAVAEGVRRYEEQTGSGEQRAAEALAGQDAPTVTDRVIRLMGDSDPEVGREACFASGGLAGLSSPLDDPGAAARLLDSLPAGAMGMLIGRDALRALGRAVLQEGAAPGGGLTGPVGG